MEPDAVSTAEGKLVNMTILKAYLQQVSLFLYPGIKKQGKIFMKIYLNGKEEVLEKSISIADFLTSMDLEFEAVVVELNKTIVETVDYGNKILKENDRLEVLRFVGGG